VSTLTRAKIALALIGLFLFGAGVRLERTELRWAGLAFVVVAWLLRFAGPRASRHSEKAPE
jgi:glucose dehydrogenase